jgi:hypothetical protein
LEGSKAIAMAESLKRYSVQQTERSMARRLAKWMEQSKAFVMERRLVQMMVQHWDWSTVPC